MSYVAACALSIVHAFLPFALPGVESDQDSGNARYWGAVGDEDFAVGGSVVRPGSEQAPVAGSERAGAAVPAVMVTYQRWVYACPGNGWGGAAAVDVSCEAAVQACSVDPAHRAFVAWSASGPPGQAPPAGAAWSVVAGSRTCQDPAAVSAADPVVAVPVVTAQDLRRLPLPPATAHVLKGAGQVLINVPTIVHAEAAPVTFPITLLGQPVTVRATPSSYSWDFGDDSLPLVTTDPGRPYPDHTLSHTYRTAGPMAITLTVTWAGEYSVAGGPWQLIDGTATVTSPPNGLEVVEARARLVG